MGSIQDDFGGPTCAFPLSRLTPISRRSRARYGDALLVLEVRQARVTMACKRHLAGLVAITGSCAFCLANFVVIIGIIAGLVVCVGVLFNDNVTKIDDPCGAISVDIDAIAAADGCCVALFAVWPSARGPAAASHLGISKITCTEMRRKGRQSFVTLSLKSTPTQTTSPAMIR